MKTLTERKFELEKLKNDLTEKEKSLLILTDKIKSCEEVEKAKSYTNEFDLIEKAVTGLRSQIDVLQSEIAHDEATLKSLYESSQVQMQKNKSIQIGRAENYLKTKQALTDYASMLGRMAGQDLEEVNKEWEKHLLTKGITNPDEILPQPVVTAIKDAFSKSGTIWATFKKIPGVTKWSNAWNELDEYGKGHADPNKDKQEQRITFKKRDIDCGMVYKYIKVPKYLIKETKEVLVRYILEELPANVVKAMERAAIIGDGLAANHDEKITSFIPMANDDVWFNTNFEIEADVANYFDTLILMAGSIQAEGNKYLVMSDMTYTRMKLSKDADGRYIDSAATSIGGAKTLGNMPVITVHWLPDIDTAADDEVIAVMYAGDAYEVIGDESIETYQNFILQKNSEEFLAEIYCGGAMMQYKGAATLKKVTTP